MFRRKRLKGSNCQSRLAAVDFFEVDWHVNAKLTVAVDDT